MELMTEEEKGKMFELAKRTQRDKKLARLLNPPPEDEVKEMPEEYLPKNLSPVGSYSGT